MNLILDTHTLLWWLNDDATLSGEARTSIGDGSNVVFVSAVSIWEIRIKQQLGKLDVPGEIFETLINGPYDLLDINAEHAFHVGSLPLFHRDPFDRILISQARIERLTMVSRDTVFQRYEVPLILA